MMEAKYKILVLVDLSETSHETLKNALNLAKVIGGSLEVFHVKSLTNIVKNENQISAMRSLDEEKNLSKRKLQNLVNIFSKEESIPLTFDFAFGNVKNEIEHHIEKIKPDIIVLGKRRQKVFNFLGEDVTQFLLNKFFGIILIAGEGKNLQSIDGISIGFYSDTLGDYNVEITKDLSKKAISPIKFFKVRKRSSVHATNEAVNRLKSTYNGKNVVEYEFEESSDALINFVSKNKIGLLCMGRGGKKKDWTDKFIGEIIGTNRENSKLKAPLLIYGR
ncbi:universal stress protein [Lutibacter profundi]|nr:universal stress protein [Lutibacter profundi]